VNNRENNYEVFKVNMVRINLIKKQKVPGLEGNWSKYSKKGRSCKEENVAIESMLKVITTRIQQFTIKDDWFIALLQTL